jgi:hypothetical protein
MIIEPQCRQCGRAVKIEITSIQYFRWQAGELIQNVFPELSSDLRELMISSTCGSCFAKLFPSEDES